ncbi:Putative OsmC/Ohr family, K domain-like, alpha/beta, OsmC/Ohr superfamily protein [Septoria linicola]|uniref:OsmC/Ohr family, K domain-like, alpha/beta, OsmC/Ohr superfamily protein n=1 Tax=Septoria linicola TaxID=215465 RepID=A0A9Q9AXG7_9PEZI|nr:Putative OsmC/Ohr family, K domain-like, alpha/beta, OsmC/Ohr superfamily protein [Septoria linicola]
MASLYSIGRLAAKPSRLPLARTFATTFPRKQTIPFEVRGLGNGVAQEVSVKGSSHTINTDAYPAFGGQDASPSPLHFNLAALSSCTQVTGSIVAKDLGIKLGKWDVTVAGQLDPSVLVRGKEGNANWKAISLEVKLESDADKAKFEEFTRETERRCPVTQLFKRSGAEWSSNWQNKSA